DRFFDRTPLCWAAAPDPVWSETYVLEEVTMKLHRKVLVLLFVLVTYPVAAQVDRATLTGTVTDSTGALIVGAKVEAVSSGTALRRETNSGGNGAYEMPGLPIGKY